ncbi:MAG: hypothetical protein WDZ39_00845 [Candidatus Spechtbacterales bacterium]
MKGLRYNITSHEVAAIAHAFMRAHNRPLKKNLNSLSIYFINETRYEKTKLNRFIPKVLRSYTAGQEIDNYLAATATIYLFLPHLKTKREFIKTLVHELDHVLWGLEYPERFYTLIPYYIRPYEMRARRTAHKWYKKAKRISQNVATEERRDK